MQMYPRGLLSIHNLVTGLSTWMPKGVCALRMDVVGTSMFEKILLPSTRIRPNCMKSSAYLLEHIDFKLRYLDNLMAVEG